MQKQNLTMEGWLRTGHVVRKVVGHREEIC